LEARRGGGLPVKPKAYQKSAGLVEARNGFTAPAPDQFAA